MGKAASSEKTSYLLSTFQRGNEARHKLERECLTDATRFMKTLSRIDIKDIKRKTMESQKLNVAKGVRDIFARLLTLAARESKAIDLHHILCYQITDVPLSLAHADRTPLKTEKAPLTKLLESKQTSVLTNINLPSISCSVIDRGLILHEVFVQHTMSSYVDIATDRGTKQGGGVGGFQPSLNFGWGVEHLSTPPDFENNFLGGGVDSP